MLHFDKTDEAWRVLGKARFHTSPVCDVLFIPPSTSCAHVSGPHKLAPRLISLAQDRVSVASHASRSVTEIFLFRLGEQQIVEYDLSDSVKTSRGLTITFAKRIFQSAVPVSMTLVRWGKNNDEHLFIADSELKFKLFDKNTFELLATFLGPIYESNVNKFVSCETAAALAG